MISRCGTRSVGPQNSKILEYYSSLGALSKQLGLSGKGSRVSPRPHAPGLQLAEDATNWSPLRLHYIIVPRSPFFLFVLQNIVGYKNEMK